MEGPPASSVSVSGAGFGAYEVVDIYFDTSDEALAIASNTGNFSGITISVPASAAPGTHYITAAGRHPGSGTQVPFTVATNWAQYRYSPRHHGNNTTENVLSPANVSELDLDWSYTTGNLADSPPAVANGIAYIGSHDHHVYALNATTGAKLWDFPTAGNVLSSPAVARGVVYIGSFDHHVYALNATTGAKLWDFPTAGNVFSSPAVARGMVYIGSDDGHLYALNAYTGAKVWSFLTGSLVESSPAVANGVVYVGSDDSRLYALNAYTGTEIWSFPTNAEVFSSPAVANGRVYVGSDDGNLYSFNLVSDPAVQRPTAKQLHLNYTLRPQNGK
jgi:outer membrane protein assembly factor BamB